MQAVRDRIERRKREIAAHPFHDWIRDADSPLDRRFDFAPALATFILGFSDMNRWFMRYDEETDEYRRAINHHTLEDEKHSALFLEDWRKLGLDERFGWTAGETLAWYHCAPETEMLRRDGQWMLRMFVENPDPLVRFALMESIESWGHVVFAATAEAASALTERTGVEYRYFGPYHLNRELGTLIDGDELFDDVVLDEDRRRRALALVDGLFDLAEKESDELLRFARQVTESGPVGAPQLGPAPATTVPAPRDPAPSSSAAVPALPSPASSPSATRLEGVLDERRRAAAAHPLIAWIGDGEGSAADRLRRIAAFWAPDCLGYRDLTVQALSYPDPTGPQERSINRWTGELGTHHRLFLRDWATLDVDGHLGLGAVDTLELYCRSPFSEAQRESAATFVTLAHRHPDPVSRYWLLVALQASGEAFFAATRALALQVEDEQGLRLDYLADRHEAAHGPLPADPEAEAVRFPAVALDGDAERVAAAIVHAVFDRLEVQMTASLERAREGSALTV